MLVIVSIGRIQYEQFLLAGIISIACYLLHIACIGSTVWYGTVRYDTVRSGMYSIHSMYKYVQHAQHVKNVQYVQYVQHVQYGMYSMYCTVCTVCTACTVCTVCTVCTKVCSTEYLVFSTKYTNIFQIVSNVSSF